MSNNNNYIINNRTIMYFYRRITAQTITIMQKLVKLRSLQADFFYLPPNKVI